MGRRWWLGLVVVACAAAPAGAGGPRRSSLDELLCGQCWNARRKECDWECYCRGVRPGQFQVCDDLRKRGQDQGRTPATPRPTRQPTRPPTRPPTARPTAPPTPLPEGQDDDRGEPEAPTPTPEPTAWEPDDDRGRDDDGWGSDRGRDDEGGWGSDRGWGDEGDRGDDDDDRGRSGWRTSDRDAGERPGWGVSRGDRTDGGERDPGSGVRTGTEAPPPGESGGGDVDLPRLGGVIDRLPPGAGEPGDPGDGVAGAAPPGGQDGAGDGDGPPATPGELASSGAAAGGLAVLGTLLILQSSGVRLRDLGEELGVVAPESPRPRDGDENERGEVWSDEDGGWVGRNLYEQERARRDGLAKRLEADRQAGQDEDVARLYRRWLDSREELGRVRGKLLEKQWDYLATILEAEEKRDLRSGYYDDERRHFYSRLVGGMEDVARRAAQDPAAASADFERLAELIERQGSQGYEIVRTTRDRVEDVVLRGGAIALDLALTRGLASAAISTVQGTREAMLQGKSDAEAVTHGLVLGGIEAAIAGVGGAAYKLGLDPLLSSTAAAAAVSGALSARDRLEAGQDLLTALGRGSADGAFAGGVSYLAGKAMEPVAVRVNDVLATLRPAPGRTPLDPDVAAEVDGLRPGIAGGDDGRPILGLKETLAVQRDPRLGRSFKTGPDEVADVADAYHNRVTAMKAEHQQAVVGRLQAERPEYADLELRLESVSTPGREAGARSVDYDVRMVKVVRDGDGRVVAKLEVPRAEWEGISHREFARMTGYDEGAFRAALPPGERAAFDRLGGQAERLRYYQERHGWLCTDRHHVQASADFSRQAIDPSTGRAVSLEQPNIVAVKHGRGKLQDAEGLAHMYRQKVLGDGYGSATPTEGAASLKKMVETYQSVRDGMARQGCDVGKVRGNLREVMAAVRQHGDAAAAGSRDAEAAIQAALRRSGYRNHEEFTDQLQSNLGALKVAGRKARLGGDLEAPFVLGPDERR